MALRHFRRRMEIKVEGVDKFVADLRDLGINRLPNYLARALTAIAEKMQDAMIDDTRRNLQVRGNWLTKGYKYGINRKRAFKNDLNAEVYSIAPWLFEQETMTLLKPRESSTLAVPRIWQRESRTAATKSPRSIPGTIRLKTKYGNEMIARREGTGRLSRLVPLFYLRKQTPERTRIHLYKTGMDTYKRVEEQTFNEMLKTAINERSS